jgi:wyosine [tRNA(Phe)-imidazoG37] synthetase (radical SAM superfamily)
LNYKYIFGPVASRRLGVSLGVDLVPYKTCTLDCVYCECGKTTCLTLKRDEYVPVKQVIAELDAYLFREPQLDFVTFSGSGEPTLHSGIGEMIRFLKSAYPQYKVALLTNGTLLHIPDVRKAVVEADLIKVSLDAASENSFKKINGPHPGLELSRIIDGLISLREEFSNKLWVEVFIVPGINDSEVELTKIKKVLRLIKPDKIQINTLDRPGTEPWVKSVDQKTATDIAAFFYGAEVIGRFDSGPKKRVLTRNLNKRLLATLKRRPSTVEDISRILDADTKDVQSHLDDLVKKGEIERKEMPRGIFYTFKKES